MQFFCLKAHIERYKVVTGFKTSVVYCVRQEVVITREIKNKEENGLVPIIQVLCTGGRYNKSCYIEGLLYFFFFPVRDVNPAPRPAINKPRHDSKQLFSLAHRASTVKIYLPEPK